MSALTVVPIAALPRLVDRAAQALSAARSSAEVLEAREVAGVAYDAAKRAARLAQAKGAHDELVAAAHRAQADALEIEALAKRRLADEYDAAQARGEVQRHGGQGKRDVPVENIPSVAEIGLTRKAIHEARQIRNAESASPGLVRRTLDTLLSQGKEPTKAAVRAAVDEVVAPTANVVTLADKQPPLPSFAELDRQNDAAQAAADVMDNEEVDLESVDGRAHAFNGALSTLDIIAITGREYWSVFSKDPAKTVYEKWVRAAHAKLSDILKEVDHVRNEDGSAQARRQRKGTARARA